MQRASYTATVLKKVGNTDPAAKSDTTSAQSGSTTDSGVLDEWSLPGMPKKPEIAKGQSLTFADGSQLTAKQRANASDLKTQLEEERDREAAESARTWVAVVGVALFLYALVIVLAFLLDLAFPLFSILKIVTAGSLTVHHESQSRAGVKELGAPPRGRWATWGNVFTTAGLVAALGGLLISGTLVRWVASFMQMLYM